MCSSDLFERLQATTGIASYPADDIAQFVFDDMAADVFVSQPELFEVVIVEEMSEGAVADIMQQTGDANETFDTGS